MSNNRYWTVIVFVIGVTIVFMNRRYSSIFQSRSNTPDWRDLFITLAKDSEIYGADSLNNTTFIPRISLFDFLRWELRYFSISLLDTLVKRKVWILFEPFQYNSSDKSWNLEFILLPISAKFWIKTSAEMSKVMRECLLLLGTDIYKILNKNICRNVKSDARMFTVIRYKSFYLWPHSLRIISAKDIYVTKIGIFPFLDDTCYFISQLSVILP